VPIALLDCMVSPVPRATRLEPVFCPLRRLFNRRELSISYPCKASANHLIRALCFWRSTVMVDSAPSSIEVRFIETPAPVAKVFRFGTFEASADSEELRRAGARVRIQPQPFAVLLMLLERSGEVVTREELRQGLWPDATHGDFDQGLNIAVKKLRETLRDSAEAPRFIETLPRRGYRFLAPVTDVLPRDQVEIQLSK
jgi:DNA-binding winged helix-turn-helix (wHTH) protein